MNTIINSMLNMQEWNTKPFKQNVCGEGDMDGGVGGESFILHNLIKETTKFHFIYKYRSKKKMFYPVVTNKQYFQRSFMSKVNAVHIIRSVPNTLSQYMLTEHIVAISGAEELCHLCPLPIMHLQFFWHLLPFHFSVSIAGFLGTLSGEIKLNMRRGPRS